MGSMILPEAIFGAWNNGQGEKTSIVIYDRGLKNDKNICAPCVPLMDGARSSTSDWMADKKHAFAPDWDMSGQKRVFCRVL